MSDGRDVGEGRYLLVLGLQSLHSLEAGLVEHALGQRAWRC